MYYIVTCEISDVTISTTCMNVICANKIVCMVFNLTHSFIESFLTNKMFNHL